MINYIYISLGACFKLRVLFIYLPDKLSNPLFVHTLSVLELKYVKAYYFYVWLIYYACTKDVTLYVQGLFPYTPHLAHFIVPECILFTPPTKNTGTSLGRNPTLEESAPPMGVVFDLFLKHAMALHYTHTAMESRCALNGANHSKGGNVKQRAAELSAEDV